ncbi:MAG: sulfite exporter TauE/SafE family protein [Gemmatimonadetes bacterium]|nr:sulfite exporter TauE/SafE family protein [Gemmatimonadota bacterium]MXY50744.1 sulfite exporter TauE/SafE family protein [Gemmatimonadota bacterium]MYG86238.1 sulfite exporter TauE/SafE family protein [Gemmatimonadota bacterium]MYJ90262.1 sulfite exporter TauE/SafE family protein [Gemmatimonadota bacterium]
MEFELWQLFLLAGVGVLSGFLNVMAGGGSLLALPVLIFLGLPGNVANGTNRVAIVAQNVSAVTSFFKQGYSELRTMLTLALCAVPGAALGAYLGTQVSGELFNRILGGLMIVLLILMSRKPRDAETTEKPKRLVLGHLLMVAVGFYGGFIQAGVGFFLMAVLYRVVGLDLVRVNAFKVFIVGIYTLVALAIFADKGQVLWLLGAALAVGTTAGGWIGAHYTVKRGEGLIRVILNVVLVVMAIRLLL